MSESLMGVNSASLEAAAKRLRETDVPHALLRNGVCVTPAQMETAARILREAEPSVITSASGPARVTLNEPQERPGFIDRERQEQEDTLVFDVGILPNVRYRITSDGTLNTSDGFIEVDGILVREDGR